MYWPGRQKGFRSQTALKLIKQIKEEKFDLAILLANSFRSALVCSLGKVSRRVGYDRDGRGVLLTDKLLPDRYNGRFLPISAVKYYLSITDYIGAPSDDYRLELFTEPKCDEQAKEILSQYGLDNNNGYAVINAGASYGSAKCWPAEYFAKVGDYLTQKKNLGVLVVCGPRECKLHGRLLNR